MDSRTTMTVVYTSSAAHAASMVTCAQPESASSSPSPRGERVSTRESLQISLWRPWVLVSWSQIVWSQMMARGAGLMTCRSRGDTSAHEETTLGLESKHTPLLRQSTHTSHDLVRVLEAAAVVHGILLACVEHHGHHRSREEPQTEPAPQ